MTEEQNQRPVPEERADEVADAAEGPCADVAAEAAPPDESVLPEPETAEDDAAPTKCKLASYDKVPTYEL